MTLSRDQVEKVSLLARLRLSGAELDQLTPQLAGIISYVELLGSLDTESVAPMAHAVELTNVLADDEVRPSLPRNEVLAGSPKHDDACFLVPPVLGD